MAEVARLQDRQLGPLADRINSEHRACVEAAGAALEHAMEAGRLLQEVKDSLPQGEFGPWLKANFEASDRTARDYLRIWRNRELLAARQNGSGAAKVSIRAALKALAPPRNERPFPVPGTEHRTPEQEAAQRAKERKHQRLLQRAEFALRTGNLEAPPDLSPTDYPKWPQVLIEAQADRGKNLPNVLDALAHQLNILSNKADPEAVGRYLTEQRLGYEEAELRADVLAELRAGLPWLQRVLDQADQGAE